MGGSAVWLASLALCLSATGGQEVAEQVPEEKGYDVEGQIKLPPREPTKPSSCTIALNGGQYVGIPSADGSFTIRDVPKGTHFLEVWSTSLMFPQLRIHVSAKHNGRVQAKLVEETSGGQSQRFSYPLMLEPRGRVDYFERKEGFNVKMILANPMILMMGFMGLMAFALPKMMAGIDPEELKQAQADMGGGPLAAMMGGPAAAPKKKET